MSRLTFLYTHTGVLRAPPPAPPATARFKAAIGAMLAKATARLAVVDDGVPTVVEVGAEADPSVVAIHALILF